MTPARPAAVPVVFVHGMTSDPAEQFEALLPYALRSQVSLLVADFRRADFRGYQRLAGSGGPLQAAAAFDDVLDRAGDYAGRRAAKVDLVGFSGGGQFAHRYAMLFPDRISRLVVVAAGWYTWIDETAPFPYGTAASRSSGGRGVDIARFLCVPVHVLVGERDTQRGRHLRTTRRVDVVQGPHRLARGLRWADHLRSEALRRSLPSAVSTEVLPGTAHSFRQAMRRGELGPRIFGYLNGGVNAGDPVPRSTGGF